LNGNLSTDDKGIKKYEWIKLADDKLAADMTVSLYMVMSHSQLITYFKLI